LISIKQIACEIDVEPKFHKKIKFYSKIQFDENIKN